jgi:putative hydrolase of HD superfamily
MAKRIDAKMAAKFQKLIETFTLVERVAHVAGREAFENDAEHSYALAMFAWYLADAFELSLDKNALLRYALAHDLVEAYAGDTYIWDEERKKTKHEREEKARLRLIDEFPEFKDLHATISAYETREDAESRFIYALDKLTPVLKNYIQDGRTWRHMGVAYDDLVANKVGKVGDHPEMKDLLQQIIALVDENRSHYFVK